VGCGGDSISAVISTVRGYRLRKKSTEVPKGRLNLAHV